MNNAECNAVHTTLAGNTYRCNRTTGHTGDHRRANGTYVIYSWSQASPHKPQCGEIDSHLVCTLPNHHTGSHEAWGTEGQCYHRWPTPATEHPSMYAKGGKVSDSEREWFAVKYPSYASVVDKEVQKIKDDMAKATAKIEKTAAKIEKELKNLEETPVLLTLDDLKVIAYYMSSVDDEEDHEADVEAKAKIDAALKKML